jgi:hypothetical protein
MMMDPQALPERDRLAASYLQQLQGLALEISAAMDAIATNALSRFQESVAKQEMLCFSLMQIANAVAKGSPSFREALSSYDPAADQEIQAASEAIRKLNLRYAALLKHSGRSIALLSSLCRNYLGQSQEVRGPRLKRQTWSCEM